tara:strand:+ start:599 stop:1039 length:441 start_codon:yes stop_codon:yes gene_type:complete
MKKFLKWWLFVILIIMGIAVSLYFDFGNFLYENDFTKISLLIASLFAATTFTIGYKLWTKKEYSYDKEWFISEMVISLGMIGTVVGFIYMLYSVFTGIDLSDTSNLQESLAMMAKGMGTALLTTLVGLVSSVLIKCQLVMVENEKL